MKRWPLIPTLLVAAAVATMLGLGIWQLRRAEWKQDLIARFEANREMAPASLVLEAATRDKPAVAWPAVPPADDALLYRRASGFCLEPVAWRAVAGRSLQDQTGWSHLAMCRTGGGEGPGMQVDIGWSRSARPPEWKGGPVQGVIVPDTEHRIRLVADASPAGLSPSRAPLPQETSNNHLLYAMQWFFFAAAAAVIYVLALRRRRLDEQAKPSGAAG